MDPSVKALIDRACGEAGLPREVNPYPVENLCDLLRISVERHGTRPAFSSLGHTLSYEDLYRLSGYFAAWLQSHSDLGPGDRVAVQLPNLIQYPVVVFGILRAGLVVVNTNPLYSGRELVHQFRDADVKALVVLKNVAETVAGVLEQTPLRLVIVAEPADLHPPVSRYMLHFGARYIKRVIPDVRIPGAISLRDCLDAGAQLSPAAAQAGRDQLAVLQYTGGTTGVAKGAMLSHGNLVANVVQASALLNTHDVGGGQAVMLQPLPLYHIYALTMVLTELYHGDHVSLVPDPRDLRALVRAFRKSRPTIFCGLNTLFVALCHDRRFQSLDFSALRLTLSGGMALSHGAARHWEEITGCTVAEGYGLTETSPVVSGNPGSRTIIGTIGLPVPETEISIIGEQGEHVPVGEPGELCVRGPQVMQGYWRNSEETAAAMDEDGWFRTGDMARLREDGYLQIVDRKKDMIVVSGFNVYPNEVEDVLYEHDDVKECAVVGVSREGAGEAVKVFVVSHSGRLTEQEVRDFCRRGLAAYKVPKYVEFRDELPKTPVGKILRRELRD